MWYALLRYLLLTCLAIILCILRLPAMAPAPVVVTPPGSSQRALPFGKVSIQWRSQRVRLPENFLPVANCVYLRPQLFHHSMVSMLRIRSKRGSDLHIPVLPRG